MDLEKVELEGSQVEHHDHVVTPQRGAHEPVADESPDEEKAAAAETFTVPEEEERLTLIHMAVVLSLLLAYVADTFLIFGISALLTPINEDIGPVPQYVWMTNAQTIGSAALAPDIFGRRWFFLVGCIMSVIGCVVSATAQRVNIVICGQVFVGCAVSCHSLTWTALPEIFPSKDRSWVLAFVSTFLALIGSLGPLIGYAFVETSTWRNVLWLCFAIEVTSFIAIFVFYHPADGHLTMATKWEQIKLLDYVGGLLGISGLVLFLLGISFGGITAPWTSATTLVPLILGFALIVACGLWEASLWTNIRGFTVVNAAMFTLGMCFYSTAVLWPQQITHLYSRNDIIIGAWSGANGFGSIFSLLGAIPYRFLKGTNIIFTISIGAIAVISGCQAIVSPDSQIASTILVVLVNFCVAASLIGAFTIIQFSVSPEDFGVATQTANTMRSLGGAVATTIYSTILLNKATENIESKVAGYLTKEGVSTARLPAILDALESGSGNITSAVFQGLSPAVLAEAMHQEKIAWSDTFRVVYLVGIAFGTTATICAAFSRDVFHLMSNKVEVKLGKSYISKE
ncbi:hypothetical protein N7490_008264 [Penicillium lividum]|nr:hypothetical protein N7490_008264 [Penicillium lividum]